MIICTEGTCPENRGSICCAECPVIAMCNSRCKQDIDNCVSAVEKEGDVE